MPLFPTVFRCYSAVPGDAFFSGTACRALERKLPFCTKGLIGILRTVAGLPVGINSGKNSGKQRRNSDGTAAVQPDGGAVLKDRR